MSLSYTVTLADLFVAVLWILAVSGWLLNAIKLAEESIKPVVRQWVVIVCLVGVCVPPIGAVLGFF